MESGKGRDEAEMLRAARDSIGLVQILMELFMALGEDGFYFPDALCLLGLSHHLLSLLLRNPLRGSPHVIELFLCSGSHALHPGPWTLVSNALLVAIQS